MLALSKRNRWTMENTLNTGNLALLATNLVMGIALVEWANIAVAVSGAVVTVVANADRVIIAILRIVEIHRNGWKLPKTETKGKEKETA